MMNSLVSCIIPTYKRVDSLINAVNSVLMQTYINLEVLVVDDNEEGAPFSKEIQHKLKDIKDLRIRYIQQEKHVNGAYARNVGIRLSKGEFIAFLDDDDEWCADKIEKQLNFLNKNKEYDGVSCLFTYYKNNEFIRKSPFYDSTYLHRKVLERSVSVGTCTLLLKKETLDKTNYFNIELKRHQELQLILDFLLYGKIGVLNEYLVKGTMDYGENRANSSNVVFYKESFFIAVKKHFEMYEKSIQKEIYAAHYFEIILVAVREKNFQLVIKYLLKIGPNIKAYRNLIHRYIVRKNNSRS